MPEWLSADLLAARGWPSFSAALRTVHQPERIEDAGPTAAAWQRLALDELVASQLALRLVRGSLKRARGTAWRAEGRLRANIKAALPFRLTASQVEALAEIQHDLAGDMRMLRLLQGDVGSGKTIVALIAMANVAESGGQALSWPPPSCSPASISRPSHRWRLLPAYRTVLLTGKDRASDRAESQARIVSGAAQIVIGTHALFQAGVQFHRLGLVVVDEQHRFGVHQRMALSAKGEAPDLLVMTATPIPRTLVLSFFGDVDVSKLTEKPAGRLPIDTRAVSLDRLDEVVARIGRAVQDGGKAYWVCPLVEESENVDAAAAEDRFAALQAQFGQRVGLIHGRMSAGEKDSAMEDFRSGRTAILVSTTVIEVGVDVPDATIMVIEHAERFGLAQLHQLRGRVGRGKERSVCLLLYRAPAGRNGAGALSDHARDGGRFPHRRGGPETARRRRRPGHQAIRCTRVQAVPCRMSTRTLGVARDEAKLALSRDPDFTSPRAEALRLLLYLFGRDDAVRLMRAG
jgi:ATP-dependent DNA helicase RecG